MFNGFFTKDNIRFNYELAGGALMDIGTYSVSALRGVFAAQPCECVNAKATPLSREGEDERCDESFKAEFKFPNGGVGIIDASLMAKGWLGLPDLKPPSLVVRQKEGVVDEEAEVNGDGVHIVRRTVKISWWPGPHY